MADRWLTIGDVFDPIDTMQKAQQIKQQQQQMQMQQMQMQQMQQEQAKNQAFQQWKSGQQPMQVAQLPTEQQMVEMQQQAQRQDAIMRGQKKFASMSNRINQEYGSQNINGETINKLSNMKRNDSDIRALINDSGFDDIDFGYDDKKKEAWERYTKTWTKDELEKIAKQVPGGNVLAGLPEGKYTIEIDPITKSIRPKVKTAFAGSSKVPDILSDPTLTDNDLARAAVMGTPEQRAAAKAILEEKARYRVQEYQTKYGGGITPEGIKFAADQYIYTGKMPPMGRSQYVRAQIMQEASQTAKELGMDIPQLLSLQADKKAWALSLNQQIKNRGMMGSFINNIEAQTELLKNKLPDLKRADSRVLNIPIRQYRKKILGSADEAIFETYLKEISNEIAKLSTNSTGSVAETSISAQEKWDKIHDPNLPVGEIVKLVDEIKHLGTVRLKSVDDEIERTRGRISTKAGKKPTQSKFKILRVQ
jgi:hypothetical protein